MFNIPSTRTPGLTPAMAPPPATLPGLSAPSRIAAAAAAAVMGLLLLFGAGFANSQGMHEAAHDARHSLGFPCH